MGTAEGAERTLWERSQQADERARSELAALAEGLARSELARRRAPPEELADLVQEAVRSTLAYVGRGAPEPKDLSAFLKYRAWGVLSDHRKRQRARPMQIDSDAAPEPLDPGRGPQAASAQRQTLAALADCRSRLPAEQRETVELRYLQGLDGAEIAARLGVHRNTIHVRVHRALIALRDCLERKGLSVEDAYA